MSPRRNLDSPTLSLASDCAPPPESNRKGGGARSPGGEGVGESQFQRLEKSLALCLLCAVTAVFLSAMLPSLPYYKEPSLFFLLANKMNTALPLADSTKGAFISAYKINAAFLLVYKERCLTIG
jgi:hypothetical protein